MNKTFFPKSSHRITFVFELLVLALLTVFFAGKAHSQTLTWDPSTNGTGSDGSGDWSTMSWANGSGDSTWVSGDSATIGLGGTPGTITVNTAFIIGNSSVPTSGLTFNTDGYTLSGSGSLNIGLIYLSSATAGTTTIAVPITITNNNTGTFPAPGLVFSTANQTLTLEGGGQLDSSNAGNFGGSGASTATLNLSALTTATYFLPNSGQWLSIGNPGTVGSTSGLFGGIEVNSGATFSASGSTSIGEGANGMLTVNNGGIVISNFFIAAGRTLTGSEVSRVVLNTGGTMTLNSEIINLQGASGDTGGGEWDVNGGTMTVTSTMILNNVSAGGQAVLNINGGTSTIAEIAIATGATGGSSTVNLSGGSLYIGTGGIVNLGAGTSTYAINLSGGILGASGNWSSSLNMSLANTTTIQAANASNVASNITLSGVLTGTGGIIKTGGGTLKLSGSNNYTGTTTVNAGTLEFNKEASLYNDTPGSWTSTNLTVASGATLAFKVGGTGQFTSSDIATLSALGTSSGGFLNGSTIGLDTGSGNFTYTGVLANTNSNSNVLGLLKLGANTLTLTGANTYTGATTVNAGTLDLGGSGATGSISSSSTLVLGGGTLNYTVNTSGTQTFSGLTVNPGQSSINASAGDTIALGAITNAGGTINFGNTGTITTTTANDSSGILGGYATFNGTDWAANNGSNVIVAFSAYTETSIAGTTASNYAGKNVDVNNSAGTLSGAITPVSLRFNTNASETVTLSATGNNIISDGGILVTPTVGAFGSTITAGTLEGSASGNLTVNQSNSSGALTIASTIANNGGATGLIKNGAGTLTLSHANTYTGVTYINGGVLSLAASNALNTTAANGGITFTGGTLQYNGATTDYSNNIKNSTSAISVDINNSTVTWASALAASNTSGLTLMDTNATPSGVLTLNAANLYSGATNINSGTLKITNTGGLGSTSSVTVASGGTLQITVSPLGTAALTLNGSSVGGVGALENLSNSDTYAGLITLGSNASIGSVTNTLTLSNPGTITGSGFNLTLVGSSAINISSVIGTGPGSVIMNNTGTVTLSTANTYTGGTVVNSGTLISSSLTGLGTGAVSLGATSGSSNATIVENGAGTVANPLNVIAGSSGNTLTVESTVGNNTYSGAITLANNLTIQSASNGVNNWTGGITGTGNVTINGSTNLGSTALSTGLLNFNGSLTNAGTGTITTTVNSAIGALVTNVTENSATSALTLSGTDTNFAGTVNVSAGTLKMNNAAALNVNNVVSVASGGTFDLNGNSETIAGLSTGSGTVTNSSASAKILTLGGSGNYSFGGVITATTPANLALTMSGTGTQTLTGVNTYAGATTINSGTVTVGTGGSIANTSSVTVYSGGSLLFGTTSATNNLSGPVSLKGGTLGYAASSPGNSVISTGALTLSSSSTLDFGSGRSGSNNNSLSFSSLSNLSAGVTLTVANYLSSGTYGLGATTSNAANQDGLFLTTEYGSSLGTQLTQIVFNNSSGQMIGYGEEVSFSGGGYEIVPISTPEPPTILVGILFTGILAWNKRNVFLSAW